jgi:Fe-S cluster biogenesis protein NfuA
MPKMAIARTKTSQTLPEKPLRDRVADVLAKLRPAVQGDGGDIQLVEVSADGVVRVRLLGACVGCPSSAMTLKDGVERNLRESIPEVREVVCV